MRWGDNYGRGEREERALTPLSFAEALGAAHGPPRL